jgi:hypothetical protein
MTFISYRLNSNCGVEKLSWHDAVTAVCSDTTASVSYYCTTTGLQYVNSLMFKCPWYSTQITHFILNILSQSLSLLINLVQWLHKIWPIEIGFACMSDIVVLWFSEIISHI